MDIEAFRVSPGSTVDLTGWNPDETGDQEKSTARALTKDLNRRLEALQEVLYAEEKHKVLVVIQATDTGGKDGTIRHVFDRVNPQGVKVASFKKPTSEEIAHDYLWRVHAHTPANGEMTLFNRSHYEDVLIVRVHDLVPEARWQRRYKHIRDFEQLLADEGTTIIKLFLHISKDEQKRRLEDRLARPEKHWKFEMGDLEQRKHWDAYQDAFTAMLEETSTADAPWFVIPANKKWFRNLLISEIMVQTLEGLHMAYPTNEDDLSGVTVT